MLCRTLLLCSWLLLAIATASATGAAVNEIETPHVGFEEEARQRWKPAAFPNPQTQPGACGRTTPSSLCDPEGVLSKQAADMVQGLINEIADGAPPFCTAPCGEGSTPEGYRLAVAVLHHMFHHKQADKAATAEAFARALHDDWGVGNPACQNGALLLLAVGDKQVYISTGAGVAAVVPDAQLKILLDTARPALKHKRYDDAVLTLVQGMGLALAGQAPEPPGVDIDDGWGIFAFFCASVAAVLGWSWVSGRRQSARFKRCAKQLEAIRRDQSAVRARQYAATTCPVCLEDFIDSVQEGSGGSIADVPTDADAGAGSDTPAGSSPSNDRPTATTAAAAAGEASTSTSTPLLGRSSSSTTTKGGVKGRRPLVLRCGHVFCDPCITRWLKDHSSCPICRKDIEAAADEAPPAPTTPAAAAASPATPPSPQQQQQLPRNERSRQAAAAAAAAASCSGGTSGVPPQLPPQDVVLQQVWLPELGFRLRRLRVLYPDFITDPMLYAWEEDLAAGRALDVGTMVAQFEAGNPERRAALERAGTGGASSSAAFGGGSSYGGGGAGSSW